MSSSNRLYLKFTFDNLNWIITDITEKSVECINKCIWVLLHTLNAKQITFEMVKEDLI
jgi:hypothetical protein